MQDPEFKEIPVIIKIILLILLSTAFYFFLAIIFESYISEGAYNRSHFYSTGNGTVFFITDFFSILFSYLIIGSKLKRESESQPVLYSSSAIGFANTVFVSSVIMMLTIVMRIFFV